MGIAPETWPDRYQKLIRTWNRYVLNPLMLPLAGKPYWYASVIRHTGRRSGKHFSTPVVADRVGGEVLIPLPYGTNVDWVRNVMAAGEATLVHKGETLDVVSPELIDSAKALPLLHSDRRRTFERVRIRHFLRMRVAR